MIYEHWSQVPRTQSAWPWEFFQPREVADNRTGQCRVEPRLLDGLNILRRILNRPITLNSVYRSPYTNALCGGAVFSQHLLGTAADISTNGQDRQKILRLAKQLNFTGFGYYRSFLHVDLGRPREWGKEKKLFLTF